MYPALLLIASRCLLAGAEIGEVSLIGGGARSRAWGQIWRQCYNVHSFDTVALSWDQPLEQLVWDYWLQKVVIQHSFVLV